ncbi:MAG TPA: hypothetical protein VHT03_13025 [Rhizomicrobium sp.]|jgi:uncharacterized protein YacL|nr:hypothetical protein [Rhizomicrobium sp.]
MSGFLSRGIVIVAVLLACVIGLTAAFGLLVAADYFAFATILSPTFAALAAAGTAIFFCILAVIIGKVILSGMKKRARRNMHARIATVIGEVFGADLGEFTERHPARSIAAALFAGFVLGFSPKIRKALTLFLRR